MKSNAEIITDVDAEDNTHDASWIDGQYKVYIDQHWFFSEDGAEWVDSKNRIAMTIGFKNASIKLVGGPENGEVVG